MRTCRLVSSLALCLGVQATASCGPIEVKIPSSTTVEVPGTGILGDNPLAPNDVFPAASIGEALAANLTQSFDTSGYDKAAVQSLKLTALRLSVSDPEAGGQRIRHLGFLEQLAVFLGAPSGAPIKVAESAAGAFADRPARYDVPLTDAELAEAFKTADVLEMSAEVTPGPALQFNAQVTVDSEITVQLGL